MPNTIFWNLVIPLVLQAITVAALYQYMVHRVDGVCQVEEYWKRKFDKEYLIVALIMLISGGLVYAKGYFGNDDGWVRAMMNAEVMIWLWAAGYIDLKERIIPNALILAGLLFWLVLCLMEVLLGGTPVMRLLAYSGIGGLVCGGVLFVIALIVKSALGMGDVKLFFVLGLLYGMSDAYGILLFTVIALGITSIALLIAKKVTMKTAIPMAPFVIIGFALSILAGM